MQTVSFILIYTTLAVLFLSFVLLRKNAGALSYHNRWVWGVVISCIIVFLAIQTTGLMEQSLNMPPQKPGLLLRTAQETQSRMVGKLDLLDLPDEDKAVLATLTVNYRKAMTRELRNRFSVTGVTHLLAVSGFHVGIVCAFINYLLTFFSMKRKTVRWIKYLITMLCVWAFTFISGLATPAVRAAFMITIYMTGRILGRNTDKYNTFAGTAFCMLVYNPFYLFDVGFQLSFTAVFFILYLQPRFSGLLEIRNPLIATPFDILTVTIAAQIGVSFLCFYYFGMSSLVFLFTNLALSLLANLLIPLTLIWMIVPQWIPGIEVVRWAVETITRWFMWIVERFSFIPGATLSIRFDLFMLITSYLFLAFLLLYFRSRRYWMLVASLVTLLILLCWQLISV